MIVAIFFVGVVALQPAKASAADCTITKSLKYGMKGAEVTCLQEKLSVTPVTGYFGKVTKAAVIAFQKDKGLPMTGLFGSMSLAKLGTVSVGTFPAGCTSATGFSSTTGLPCSGAVVTTFPAGCTSATGFSSTTGLPCSTTPVVTSGPLAVSLALDNPAAGNIVAGQAIADLAHFSFSGTGTLSQVTLQRGGISSNSDLTNVYLFDGVTRVSDAASVNTNGVITFSNLNLAVSGMKVLSVKADIASAAAGTISVTMTSYTVTGGTANVVSIKGNEMYAVAATMATVAVGAVTPSNTTVNAGTNSFVLWSAGTTVGLRAVNLKSMAFQMIGSAPTDALANVKLYKNGTVISTASAVNSLGYLTFDMSAAPVEMLTGTTTLEVRGDIVKGSSRTISLALQNVSDMMVADSQLGVNISTTGIPKVAGTISVNSGSVTVTLDPTFSATTVTGGVTNVTIAKYNFKAYGEDVKISYLDVTPSRNIDNVAIYANGGQVSGNIQSYTGTKLHFTTGSSLIIPAGSTVVVEVKADTKAAGVNMTNGSILVTLNGYSNNAQGVTSSTLSTVPSSDQASTSLAIGGGTLALAQTSAFAPSQTIIANTANQKIGSFTVSSGTYEGVHITNLAFALTGTLPVTNLSNMYIKYDSTSSTPVTPQATSNNFPVDITLAVNASKTVDVYADVGNLATITNTNTTPETMAVNNAATPAANGAAAVRASGTVILGGTPTTGQNTVVTISSYNTQLAETTGQTLIQQATALVALINANSNVNGLVVATNVGGSSATITLTANTAGVAGNSITLAKTVGTGMTATVSGATLAGGAAAGANTAQISTLTPANVEIGDIFTAGVGSTTVSFTATAATVANVTAGITSAWNLNATLAAIATAADGTTVVNLTAMVSGTAGAFTAISSTSNGVHSAIGLTVITTASLSATGTTSNSTVTSSPATLAGQTMTIATGALATTGTITSSSPAAQFVIGGTTGALATYNFKASNGTAIIDELTFTVTASAGAPVSTITVGGVTMPVNGSSVLVSGLSLSIPVSYSGTNVPVTVAWNKVGLNAQASAQTASITLETVKYHVGNTTTTDTAPSVPSNTMYAVASKPTLSSTATTSSIVLGENKLYDITIAADTADDVQINTLVFTNTLTTASANIGSLAPRLAIGSTTLTGTGYSCSGTTTVTCAFPNNYIITKGTSVTFSLYGTVSGTLGSAATTSLTTSLAASSNFSWTDVAGNGSAITGGNTTYFLNYPTAVWTAKN